MSTTVTFTNDSTAPILVTSIDLNHRFEVTRVDVDIDRLFVDKYEAYMNYHDLSFQSDGIDSFVDYCNTQAINNNTSVSLVVSEFIRTRQDQGKTIGFQPAKDDLKAYVGAHRLTDNAIYRVNWNTDVKLDQWYGVPYKNSTLEQGAANLYHTSDAHANMMWFYSFIPLAGDDTYGDRYFGEGCTEVIQHGVRFLTNYRSQSLKILIYQSASVNDPRFGNSGIQYSMCEFTTRPNNLVKILRDAGHEVSFNTYNFELDREVTQREAWLNTSSKKTTATDYPFDYLDTFDVIIYAQIYNNASIGNVGSGNYFTSNTLDAFTRFARDPNKGFMFIFDHTSGSSYTNSIEHISDHWYDQDVIDKKLEFSGLVEGKSVNYTNSDASTVFGPIFPSDLVATSSSYITGWQFPEAAVWSGNTSEHQYVSNGQLVVKEKRNEFVDPIQARYMRLYPVSGNQHLSWSMEFYDGDTSLAGGLPDGAWSSDYVSDRWPVVHGPHQASYRYQSYNDIYAGIPNVPLEVDLGSVKQVTAVGTLPRNSIIYQQRVESYLIGFSENGVEWNILCTDGIVVPIRAVSSSTPQQIINIQDMPERSRVLVTNTTGQTRSISSMTPVTVFKVDQPAAFQLENINMQLPHGSVHVRNTHDIAINDSAIVVGPRVSDVNNLGLYNPYLLDQHNLSVFRNNKLVTLPQKMLPGTTIDIDVDATEILDDTQGVHDDVTDTPELVVSYECPLDSDNIITKTAPTNFNSGNKLGTGPDNIYLCWANPSAWPAKTYIKMTKRSTNQFVTYGHYYRAVENTTFQGKTGQWQLTPKRNTNGRYVWCLQFNPNSRFSPNIDVLYYDARDESFIDEYSYYTANTGYNITDNNRWKLCVDDTFPSGRVTSVDNLLDDDDKPLEFLFLFHEPEASEPGENDRVEIVQSIRVLHHLNYDPTGDTLLVSLDLSSDRPEDIVYEIVYKHTDNEFYRYIISDLRRESTLHFHLKLPSHVTATNRVYSNTTDHIVGQHIYTNRVYVVTRSLSHGGKHDDDFTAYVDHYCDLRRHWQYHVSGQTREAWGESHYNDHGKNEGRILLTSYRGYTSSEQISTVPAVLYEGNKTDRTLRVQYPDTCTDVRLVDAISDEDGYPKMGVTTMDIRLSNDEQGYSQTISLLPGREHTFKNIPTDTSNNLFLTSSFGGVFYTTSRVEMDVYREWQWMDNNFVINHPTEGDITVTGKQASLVYDGWRDHFPDINLLHVPYNDAIRPHLADDTASVNTLLDDWFYSQNGTDASVAGLVHWTNRKVFEGDELTFAHDAFYKKSQPLRLILKDGNDMGEHPSPWSSYILNNHLLNPAGGKVFYHNYKLCYFEFSKPVDDPLIAVYSLGNFGGSPIVAVGTSDGLVPGTTDQHYVKPVSGPVVDYSFGWESGHGKTEPLPGVVVTRNTSEKGTYVDRFSASHEGYGILKITGTYTRLYLLFTYPENYANIKIGCITREEV